MDFMLWFVAMFMAVIVFGLGLVVFDDFKYEGRWLDGLVRFSRRMG